jgi:hypothetical protein
MQGDLISRSKLLEEIQNWGGCVEALEEYIKKMPTAYDVEKVLAELEEASYEAKMLDAKCKYLNYDDTIHIVRNGGKE